MFLSHLIHQIIISRKNIFPPRKEISFRRIMKPGAFPKPMPFLKMLLASCSILFMSLYCCFVSIRERLGTGCGHWTSVSHHPGMFSLKRSTTWRRTWSVNIKIMSTCWNNKRLKDREFVPGAVGFLFLVLGLTQDLQRRSVLEWSTGDDLALTCWPLFWGSSSLSPGCALVLCKSCRSSKDAETAVLEFLYFDRVF